MRYRRTAAFLSIVSVATASLPPASASAEVMSWIMTNNSPYPAQVSFYSQNRDHEWPGNGQSYNLFNGRSHRMNINCEGGEKICYGAFVYKNHSRVWGVGYRNSKHCDDCCATCGETPVMQRSLGE